MSTEATTSKESGSAKPDARHRVVSKGTIVGRLAGGVGLVLLVSTPLTWLLTMDFGALVVGKLLLGLLLVGVYLATNPDFFTRVSGARSSGLLALSAGTVVLVVGLVGAANYLAYRHVKEWDLTREGVFTLTKQTTDLLARLKDDVKVYAFYANIEPVFAPTEELLERLAAQSPRFTFEMVNPESRPDLVEKFKITDAGPRLVVTARGQDTRAKEPTEEAMVNAILKVAEQTTKKIVFLKGHGELDIADDKTAGGLKVVADALQNEGFVVEALSLMDVPAVPATPGVKIEREDGHDHAGEAKAGLVSLQVPAAISVLIVAGPRTKLLEPELAALDAFLARGGRLIVMLDPENDSGLEGLLRRWKIELRNDLIVDTNPMNRLLGLGAASPMVAPTQTEHPATKDLVNRGVVFTARSLGILTGGESGVVTTALMEAGPSAWGETKFKEQTAERDDQDTTSGLNVMVVATRSSNTIDAALTPEGRIIAFGDADFATNKYVTMQGNSDWFLNTVAWAAEEESRITVRPNQRASAQLFLTGEQLGSLVFLSMDVLPVLLVAMGLGIVLVRRQR